MVIGYDNYFFQLLKYARLTGRTMLSRNIISQHIFAHRKTREEHGAVLACITRIVRTAEFTNPIITNPTMKAALLITHSCTKYEKQVNNQIMFLLRSIYMYFALEQLFEKD